MERERKELQKKLPLGASILSGLNCFFGSLFLLRGLSFTPEDFNKSIELLKSRNFEAEIAYEQIKAYNSIPIIIGALFLVSGVGIILKKNWARKATVYLAFAIVIIIFLTVLAQPQFIGLLLPQVVYLGVLIMYFTNRNIEDYFSLKTKKNSIE